MTRVVVGGARTTANHAAIALDWPVRPVLPIPDCRRLAQATEPMRVRARQRASFRYDNMNRREFNVKSVVTLLGGVVVTITGCSDSGGPTSPVPNGGASPDVTPTSPAPTTPGDVAGVVSANHGHIAVVTGAQLAAENGVVLDITGSANHSHRVELTVSEVMQIASGQRVSKASSTDFAHDHGVTFN